MRAVAITVTADHATVELRPCALARWLGAGTLRVELERDRSGGWFTVATSTALLYLDHGALIRRALDFRPVPQLAIAQVVAEFSWTGDP